MSSNRRGFGASEEYLNQMAEYSPVDALFALLLWCVCVILYFFMGSLFNRLGTELTQTKTFWITGFFSLIQIGLVFLLCRIRRQPPRTFGFSRNRAVSALWSGGAIMALIVLIGAGIMILGKGKIQTDGALLMQRGVYYLFFISLTEELIFRGYIGTRLSGLIHHPLLSNCLTGILFALLHIPFQMVIAQVGFFSYLAQNWGNLIPLIGFHFFFQWLYARNNSLIAPVLVHFVWDYIGWMMI